MIIMAKDIFNFDYIRQGVSLCGCSGERGKRKGGGVVEEMTTLWNIPSMCVEPCIMLKRSKVLVNNLRLPIFFLSDPICN